ncbi:hypothetical protein PENTCL1PPCAC_14643, partial [Pristionchus entomophagus]
RMLSLADKIHLSIIWTIDIMAIITNILLITAIALRTPKQLRSYSVFLLFNAIVDLLSASASGLGAVRVIQNRNELWLVTIFVFLGPCSLVSEHLCRLCQAMHIELVNLSTIVLLLAFAFRLYVIGEVSGYRRVLSPTQIAVGCSLVLLPLVPHTAAYYFEQTSVSTEALQRLHLSGYTTSISPVVITGIFLVRRMLIARISQSVSDHICLEHFSPAQLTFLQKSTEKRHHVFIARALTYQMLLPCGVAVASTIWMMDTVQIWSCDVTERFIMITCSLLPLASPIINFTMLPPYRAIL